MRIVLSGQAPLALGRAGPAGALADRETLILDLSPLKFATPLDVAGITLLANTLAPRRTLVILPRDAFVSTYLQRIGALDALDPSVIVTRQRAANPEYEFRQPSIRLRRLLHPDDWDDIAGDVLPDLRRHLSPQLATNVVDILGELADNAGSHGYSTAGYYVVGQYYTGAESGMPPGMWVAVVDAGRGIRDHLSGNVRYRDAGVSDLQALRLAARAGVSGVDDARGYGLADVRRMAGEVAPGRVIIRTGQGVAFFAASPKGRTARYVRVVREVPGTWVLALVGGEL
jgi:hypothetical protein